MEELRIASWVFWSSFFANQRGCSNPNLRRALLQQLVSNNEFARKVSFEDEFTNLHNMLLTEFTDKIEKLCLAWMESPAGVAWLKYLDRSRFFPSVMRSNTNSKAKAPLPMFDSKYIASYTFDESEHKGIEIDNLCMWGFWSRIIYLSEMDNLNLYVYQYYLFRSDE
jgi:hypothetical protein